MAKGLCPAHYGQQRAGKPLTPIHVRPACDFDGCDKPNHARGWCHGHYRQVLRGEELRPLGTADARAVNSTAGIKTCSACGSDKPLTEFHRNAKSASGYSRKCRGCSQVERMVSTYGLSVELTLRLMAHRNCDACGVELTDATRRFDHNHSCCSGKKSCGRCVRGVICHGCNVALGHVEDSIERLEKLVAYLKR